MSEWQKHQNKELLRIAKAFPVGSDLLRASGFLPFQLLLLALNFKLEGLHSGNNVIKLFCPKFTDFRNKLEGLSLASLSSLV